MDRGTAGCHGLQPSSTSASSFSSTNSIQEYFFFFLPCLVGYFFYWLEKAEQEIWRGGVCLGLGQGSFHLFH